jgi:hypothetical protein
MLRYFILEKSGEAAYTMREVPEEKVCWDSGYDDSIAPGYEILDDGLACVVLVKVPKRPLPFSTQSPIASGMSLRQVLEPHNPAFSP